MAKSRAQQRREEATARQARAAELRRQEQAKQRKRRLAVIGAGVVIVVGAGAGIGYAVASGSGSGSGAQASGVDLAHDAPPWPLPANEEPYIRAAGLSAAVGMAETYHIHSHLDVIVDGKPVTVPANTGIVESKGALSPLHTHDTSGILHIEHPTKINVTLGQFFTEWGVKLTPDCMGGLCTGNGKKFVAFVDGKKVGGNPADIALKPHEEIALWYGDASATPKVPSSYKFPEGY